MKRAFLFFFLVAAPAYATSKECIDANERAIQHRSRGELVAAKGELLTCAQESCPAAIRVECARRLEDVDRTLPSIVVAADNGKGTDLVLVRVTLDGKPLTDRLDGSAMPIDPGTHDLAFETVGFPVQRKTLVIREGEKERRERVVFQKPDAPFGHRRDPVLRALGIGAIGVGAAAFVASAILAGLASSFWSSSLRACASSTACPDHSRALSDHDAASSDALLSTTFFVVGGTLVLGGGVAFLFAPSVTQKGAGMIVGGTFR